MKHIVLPYGIFNYVNCLWVLIQSESHTIDLLSIQIDKYETRYTTRMRFNFDVFNAPQVLSLSGRFSGFLIIWFRSLSSIPRMWIEIKGIKYKVHWIVQAKRKVLLIKRWLNINENWMHLIIMIWLGKVCNCRLIQSSERNYTVKIIKIKLQHKESIRSPD